MAFNPEEERRRGALESGMLGGSPLGGMLSAGGTFVPQLNPFQRYMGGSPPMGQRPDWAQEIYNANPPPVDYGSDEYWAMESGDRPTFWGTQNLPVNPSDPSNGMLGTIPQQKSEAWWAAQPRPSFVPADWVYIGMGDWGPPDVYGPGGTEGPPLAGPPMPTAENPLIPGSTYSGPAGALPPGLLGPVPGVG